MAGDWIKIEHTLPDKPEVIGLSAALRIDQDAVAGKLVRIWVWADQNSIDGNSLPITCAFIDRMVDKRGFALAMKEIGWLTGEDGCISFPGFDRHNGSPAKERSTTNRRVSKLRCNARTVTDVTPEPLQKPLPEKRREEKSIILSDNTSFALSGDSARVPSPHISWDSDNGFSGISDSDRSEWTTAYPALDIEKQILRAHLWLKANPQKKKKQIRRFLSSWFSRSQERGGDISSNRPSQNFTAQLPTDAPDIP